MGSGLSGSFAKNESSHNRNASSLVNYEGENTFRIKTEKVPFSYQVVKNERTPLGE